jgi:hypothetical protein
MKIKSFTFANNTQNWQINEIRFDNLKEYPSIALERSKTYSYKYNDEGYFIKLERLYPYNGVIPQVNSTMSKIPMKLKYII